MCGYRRLGTVFVYHHDGTRFICVMMIQTSKVYPINNKKSNQWSSLICCKTGIISILVTNIILNVFVGLNYQIYRF